MSLEGFYMKIIVSVIIILSACVVSLGAADSIGAIADTARSAENTSTDITSLAPDSAAVESNFIYPMPEERKALLISYSRFNNIWRFADFFISVFIMGIVLFTGLSAKFQAWARRISNKRFLVVLFYLLILLLFLFAVEFPFSYYRNFHIERVYGFSNQTFGEWLGESLKSEVVGFIIGVPIVWVLYWLIRRTKMWWLYFALGAIPFIAFLILVAPVVIAPLFNKFEPIKNQELRREMIALAEKAGIHNPDVFEVDASKQSSKINAYFTGLFGTKRIVLYDTAIKNFSVNELKFVMGHEIGHYIMGHIWYGLFIVVFFIILSGFLINRFISRFISAYSRRLGFSQLSEPASLPLIFLFIIIFGFIFQPISNGASRYFEYQSDKFGLELSGVTGEEAAVAFDKLSVFNLADPEPAALIEFWFYDHPALKKRMENVKRLYAEKIIDS
jgi:Zn-dependent protease with chaperone function